MLSRMILAARLNVDFYEKVEADPRYTGEAFVIVLLAAVFSATGNALAYPGDGLGATIAAGLGTVFAWIMWAGITLWIGTHLTKGPETQSNMGEMLRCLGYAHTPIILVGIVFVPVLGPIVALAATIWSLLAGVVAIRQALDFTTTRALFTVLIGWFVVTVLQVLLRVLV
jgi:hypothetical protein